MTTIPPPPPAEKWICVHGHFYQPPRENPWTGMVEREPSATPYHDWNQRITVECYRANCAAAIVGSDGSVAELVNNYAHMSWNFGPTLLAWLQRHERAVYDALIMSDRASRERFDGHGSALAQAYSHLILPLATKREKITQVRWGIADFRYRFSRLPEGMWLPECAVDIETLEVLAAEGIAFTILAPHQAKAWRSQGGSWQSGPIDSGRCYRCPLPSGKSIDIFFYDGATSQAVAFERMLSDGARFEHALSARGPLQGVAPGGQAPLCHIATDGETYGHHHRFGDMALAWALQAIARNPNLRLTNYADYRQRFPAQHEVQIVENSSWSCAHGVARWRDDCGCNSGGRPGWRQHWRRPLRSALEWLRDQVERTLTSVGGVLLKDPFAARDAYVELLLDGSERNWQRFVRTHAAHPLSADEATTVAKLMACAHSAMSMFTSCGWFFDELSGIETVQVMRYAGHVCDLLAQVGGEHLEEPLLARLGLAKSNLATEGDGRDIWRRHVVPARKADPALYQQSVEQLQRAIAGVESDIEQLFARNATLYPTARQTLGELPTSLRLLAQMVLRRQAASELNKPEPSFAQLRQIVEIAAENSIVLDDPTVAKAASEALHRLLVRCEHSARTGDPNDELVAVAARSAELVFELMPAIDVFFAKSLAWRFCRDYIGDWTRRGEAGDERAAARAAQLQRLAAAMGFTAAAARPSQAPGG